MLNLAIDVWKRSRCRRGVGDNEEKVMSDSVKLTPAQKNILQDLIDHPNFHLERYVRGKHKGRWELHDPNGLCGINRHTCNALLDAGVLIEVAPDQLSTATVLTGWGVWMWTGSSWYVVVEVYVARFSINASQAKRSRSRRYKRAPGSATG